MEDTKAYVASLKEARAIREHFQSVRQKLRSEFMASIQADRQRQLSEKLQLDCREHTQMTTFAEESVFAAIRKTAKWWDVLCDHSIEQKLLFEKAQIRKVDQKKAFLESVMDREKTEERNVLESDQKRWVNASDMFTAFSRQLKEDLISSAIEEVLGATDACVTVLDDYQISLKEHNILAYFLIKGETQKQYLEKTGFSADDAFETVFSEYPFEATSAEVTSLIDKLYHMCDNRQKKPVFFEACQFPIIVVNGPKYSGKSLLTKELTERYNFRCFTDYDLVQEALAAADAAPPTRRNSPAASSPEGEAKPEEETSTWEEIGRRTKEVLYAGGSVGVDLIGEMFRLRLGDVGEDCSGILVDGVIDTPEEYKIVEQTLLPQVVHPYQAVEQAWLKGGTTLSEEEYKAVWTVEHVRFGEPAKKETKTKQPRKGVDLSQLPPPVLPDVADIDAEVAREEEFIKTSAKQLEPYGVLFSAVLHINCDPIEIFKRFAGLRVDSETGEEYHMLYAPPPEERLPFLVNLDRTKANTAQLHDVVFNQEQQWRTLHQFLRSHKEAMDVVHEIDGGRSMELIVEDVSEVVKSAISLFEVGKKLFDTVKASEARIESLKQQRKEQIEAREAERQRLVAIYTEKGVPVPAELEVNEETGDTFPVPEDMPDVILEPLQSFVEPYKEQYQWGWNRWGQLAESLLRYTTFVHGHMDSFWHQPDDKQNVLNSFVKEFNGVPSNYRSNVACKEELHYYVDVLTDALFHCNSQKKAQCNAVLGRVTRKDVFLDDWETNVCNIGISLSLAEVERFSMMVNLILIYFSSVVGEPIAVDKVDVSDISLLKLSSARTEGHIPDASSTRSKEKKSQSRKGHAKSDESPEKIVEDVFADVMTKVLSSLQSTVDRLKMTTDVNNNKAVKRGVVTPSMQRLSLIATKALKPVEEELAVTKARIEKLQGFVSKLLQQGQEYVSAVKVSCQKEIQKVFKVDAACINTAVYTIRNCIEEEQKTPGMHLGFGTFSILDNGEKDTARAPSKPRDPSFITDVPLYEDAKSLSQKVHATMDAARLKQLIQSFRNAAPDYAISLADFTLLTREDDYRAAALPGQKLLSVERVFHLFDTCGSGVVDWREYIVHLLFFCVPPPVSSAAAKESYYIPEVTVQQLIEARENLGWEDLEEVTFFDIPFFFDSGMSDERLEVYTRALWETFADPRTNTLNPSDLLWFLCADVQPIRGVQKAFYTFAAGENEGQLTADGVYTIFHTKVNAPIGSYDPFSKENIHILMGEREVITFNETCMEALGRKMLNSSVMFQRKKFVSEL
ncbi:hypothetical protein, conserved [Angomonas deanei]|uniref:EF-hand domain-containing protein n=1 Tax=Angomonas deanei TaxID=59799 RepID=A0A7G2C194_9TRYP|nr:hypothetical protein, conserved [Angomonas deanei]